VSLTGQTVHVRVLLGSVAGALILAGACSGAEDDRAWVVTGETEPSSNARSCSNIDGVTDALFSVISDSTLPEGVKIEVTDEDAARAVVDCIEEVGGTAAARRA